MTLIEFVNGYCGKKVDFDGYYGAQCVDLFRQYCKDVLEVPHTGAVEGAKDLVERYWSLPVERKHFVLCKEPSSARCGDVVVWGATQNNRYGHVAIMVAWDENVMLVFEQDGIKQDGAKLKWRTAKDVIGVLKKWNREDAA
ncbi:MAG: CHAP domain-containing protein [Treponema sp.]|nr:CHAP domain-containing protein [Treponema sp.]